MKIILTRAFDCGEVRRIADRLSRPFCRNNWSRIDRSSWVNRRSRINRRSWINGSSWIWFFEQETATELGLDFRFFAVSMTAAIVPPLPSWTAVRQLSRKTRKVHTGRPGLDFFLPAVLVPLLPLCP